VRSGVHVRSQNGDLVSDFLHPIGGLGGFRHGTSYLAKSQTLGGLAADA
jgi:hypothetical protein